MPTAGHWLALALACALPAAVTANLDHAAPTSFLREQGRCAMRDSCGRKSAFGSDIPCPDNSLAQPVRPSSSPSSPDPLLLRLTPPSSPAPQHDLVFKATLAQVCGDDFSTTTCCTLGQLNLLQASLAQAEPLLASCPACRNNFRQFYCHFTCSPDQSLFVAVAATQTLTDKAGKPVEAVQRVEFSVAPEFGAGFFDSCKGVKFGATNGYAMDLIGGGATDYLAFLRYMGQERALGSPFQIDFPSPSLSSLPNASLSAPSPPPAAPLDLPPISCASPDPLQRCACPDCPAVCAALPPVRSPAERASQRCRVGRMDCFPFALCVAYAAALGTALAAYAARGAGRRWGRGGARGAIHLGAGDGEDSDDEGEVDDARGRDERQRGGGSGSVWALFGDRLGGALSGGGGGGWARSSRLAPGDEDAPLLSDEATRRPGLARSRSSGSGTGGGLVGARSIASELDGGSGGGGGRARSGTAGSGSSPSTSRRSLHHSTASSGGIGAASLSLLDSDPLRAPPTSTQPRYYALNTLLTRAFYRLGLSCARRPALTLAAGLAACAVAHLGWGRFAIERDPVQLWVPQGSEVAREKARFDEAFGPFYRTEQVFLSALPGGPREVDGEGEDDERAQSAWTPSDEPVLSWETLEWLVGVEDEIRALRSSDDDEGGVSLADVCFAPTSSAADGKAPSVDECVVQSPLGYLSNSLDGVSPSTWASVLDDCAASPASCLPPFGQPLNPKLVLSVAPSRAAHDARAVILTYVVRNSLDPLEVARAEAWERALAAYLRALAAPRGGAARRGVRVSWSVGTSLESELNAATNTDVPIVVGSYLVMFVYVAVSLGGSGSGLVRAIVRAAALALAALASGGRWLVRRARGGGGAIKLGGEERVQVGGTRSRSASAEPELVNGTRALGAYVRKQVLVDSRFLLGASPSSSLSC